MPVFVRYQSQPCPRPPGLLPVVRPGWYFGTRSGVSSACFPTRNQRNKCVQNYAAECEPIPSDSPRLKTTSWWAKQCRCSLLPGDLLHPLVMANLKHPNNRIFSIFLYGLYGESIQPSTQQQHAYYLRAPAFQTSERIPTGLCPATQNWFRWSQNLLWGETRKKHATCPEEFLRGHCVGLFCGWTFQNHQVSPMRLPIFVGKNSTCCWFNPDFGWSHTDLTPPVYWIQGQPCTKFSVPLAPFCSTSVWLQTWTDFQGFNMSYPKTGPITQ